MIDIRVKFDDPTFALPVAICELETDTDGKDLIFMRLT